jgi:NitT/TauT family transport system substrate-binding protein
MGRRLTHSGNETSEEGEVMKYENLRYDFIACLRATSHQSRIVFFGLIASAALVLVSAVPASAQKPEPVTIQWGGTVAIELEAPLLIAISQGYLAEQGLKLENPMMGPGPRVRESLAAGELDFGDVGTFTYIVGRAAGLRQRIVFEYYAKEIFSLFVSTKLQGTVKSVADLKGHKIGVTAIGSSTHMAALSFVKKAGLKDTDVTIIPLQSADPAVMMTALESGQIDALMVYEPMSILLLDRKTAFPLVDVENPADHEKWVGKSASSMVLAVSEDTIAKRPDLVRRATAALKKAMVFIHTKSPSEIAAATAKGFKMNQALLTRVFERIKDNFSPDGSISRAGIEVELSLARGGGALKKPLTYEDMVDTQFAGSRN